MTPHYADDWLTVYHGDARTVMAAMEPESVHCVVTSPPYWGLRDYGEAGQLGLEPTPEAYVESMVAVFREVRRVLRSDGTVWLNLGDTFAAGGKGGGGSYMAERKDAAWKPRSTTSGWRAAPPGLKPKDLVGIPWMVAFALRADGWYLRSDIIWSKPNPMPESVTDRPTKSHEYLFLLSKSARYYYDAEAIGEPVAESTVRRLDQPTLDEQRGSSRVPGKTNGPMKAVPPRFGGAKYGDNGSDHHRTKSGNAYVLTDKRNARTVWTVATQPYPGAHFATFPPKLIEPCIRAGTPEKTCGTCGEPWAIKSYGHRRSLPGDVPVVDEDMLGHFPPECHPFSVRPGVVLDPFAGSGTTGMVAQSLSRRAVLIDLSMDYLGQLMDRNRDIPLGLGA